VAQTPEIVAEVRIHGNYRTPDANILALAGVTVGQPLDTAGIDAVAERLRKTGRFQSVDIRKRVRSLTATDQVALIIIVEEFPSTPKGGGSATLLRRLGDRVMAIPMLDYIDGYGVAFGGRISLVGVIGKRGVIGMPLTWGATRQAAVEIDTTFNGGVIRRIRAGAGLLSRGNPAYDLRDFRQRVWADVTTPAWMATSLTARTSWSDVTFGATHGRLTAVGAGIVIDTRANPAFPRNAVYVTGWWDRLTPDTGPAFNRYRVNAHGYVGLVGSTVLSVRILSDRADRPVPIYERPLLGGIDNLRGFAAGAYAGDNLAAASVELRIPLHSPMRLGQIGVTAFGDVGAVYDHGERLADATRRSGVGIGWYLRAPLIQLGLDVARGSNGKTRAHVTAGLRF
jgi:outer membrane protein assembly factor BamA